MRKHLQKILFTFLLILFFAFNFQGNPPSGWYQQFLPNIDGQAISDMLFLDSLNGFLITESASISDTSYILKTTNGGDNWEIKFRAVDDFSTIKFANSTTGFMCGSDLYKTTNAGENWFVVPAPNQTRMEDMEVFNSDTLWVVDADQLTGGVFRTTNGGINWIRQLAVGSDNPSSIYFYNKDIGFTAGGILYKTTNGGANWFTASNSGFGHMEFINELTGWKSYGIIQKTTDGGINWIELPIPAKGGNILLSRVYDFDVINKDTIWGAGSVSTSGKGLIYLTNDGGQTWGYQLPSPSFNIFQYTQIQFSDNKHGWAYGAGGGIQKGVHTVTGGNDTTIIVSVNPISSEVPKQYKLEQNYPNPFNPSTTINYELKITNYVSLKIYDLNGKEVAILINKKQSAGVYSVEFNGGNFSSGIYFYSLFVDGVNADTKKMMLIK